jgi:hypothetical protein
MPLDLTFGDQAIDGLARIRANPAFRLNRWWLTFYLISAPERLDALAHELARLGGENLHDTWNGSLYAKIPVHPDLGAIRAIATQVAAICDAHGVWLNSIDADTSAEVGASHFEELYQSNAPSIG